MIYRLQKKFITISGLSLAAVCTAVICLILLLCIQRLNLTMDELTDRIYIRDGRPPEFSEKAPGDPGKNPPPEFINDETKFATRFFTAELDGDGNTVSVNTDRISGINGDKAAEMAKEVKRQRGWLENYRYKVISSPNGKAVIFVDASMNIYTTRSTVFLSAAAVLGSGTAVFVFILIFSKRAVRPAAESYEKQKQFITDAGHELKTPLTLIMANAEILDDELPGNEWIKDIKHSGERMRELTEELIALSKIDEGYKEKEQSVFDLSEVLFDTVQHFSALSKARDIETVTDISPNIKYSGNESDIRRLISILIDNAWKYCDEHGVIKISLSAKKHPIIEVENTFANAGELKCDRLFDRFYRGDASRSEGGYGIGLSIAEAVVKNHRGEISAHKKDGSVLFRVVLK